MNRPEILAPVGGKEQLLAAVRCGADAVYFGAQGFNARRNADNFDENGFREAVRYCHGHGVHVYITLNTLVFDKETDALIETIDEIAESGADAVIVQDFAVAKLLRERYPELPRHASTQMAVHNADGVRLMEELGFSQAVLARELSLEEIRKIRSETEIPLECFVHGALCVCLSGSCYLSSLIGTRSGNRGLCAQPCRLDFRLNGRDHALSLKDMSAIGHIAGLRDAGISTLKIEGRMKRPEYVAAAVTACKKAMAGEPADVSVLRSVFSRSGFTDGYFTGRRGAGMFGIRTREDVTAAAAVLPKLRELYREEKGERSVDLTFTAKAGENASLVASDGMHTVTVEGPVPEPARNVPMTEQSVSACLMQTGGTPFKVNGLSVRIDEGMSMPVSAQKRLRREALEQLENASVRGPWPSTGKMPEPVVRYVAPETPELRIRAERFDQLPAEVRAEKIILPVGEVLAHPEEALGLGSRLIAELPAVCFPEDTPRLERQLEELKELGVGDVLAENAGSIVAARRFGFTVHGGALLNVLNTAALGEYERLGLADCTLSFEMPMREIERLGGSLPRGIIAAGYLPLMRTRSCPAMGENGCGSCTGVNVLTDEHNEKFTMLCRDKRYREIFNSVPLYIGDKRIASVDFVTIYLTTETRDEASALVNDFLTHAVPGFRRTNGLYFRELQ